MTTETGPTAASAHLDIVTSARGRVPATVVAPAADDPPRGGVVVIQDARGITPYLVSVCDRFASAGLLAIAPHLYHRDGIAQVDPTGGWPSAISQMGTLTGGGIAADVDDCIGHLADAGIDEARTGIVGFCMGGTVALFTGTRHRLGAAVSFYGGGVSTPYWDGVPPLVELAPSLKTPWLGLYGEQDPLISADDLVTLREAASAASVPTGMVSYPGAGHAFHSDDREAVYRPAAATDAWARTLAFLDQRLRPVV